MKSERKNILLILCDQLRKDTLGCYGDKIIKTPNIDSIAEEGMRFENMFSVAPVCGPSRASLFTGKYADTHGEYKNGVILPKSELTLAELLRQNGYETMKVGKFHFEPQWDFNMEPESFKGALCHQPQKGEIYYGFEKALITEDHKVGPYEEFLKKHGRSIKEDPHSFSYGKQHYAVRSSYPEELHQTTWIGNESIKMLKERDKKRPFFMVTSFVAPHHPFVVPEPYDKIYDISKMPLPIRKEGELDDKLEFYKDKYYGINQGHETVDKSKFTDEDWKRIRAFYYGMITQIDVQIGRIIEELKREGVWDDTLVIFTSDHGELLGDHWLLFKGIPYISVYNVPFLIRLPGVIPAGKSIDSFAENIDIFPTVVELATGEKINDKVRIQGKSLINLILGKVDKIREDVYIEEVGRYGGTLITDKYWLTVYPEINEGVMYDLQNDPNQFINLYNKEEYKDIKIELMNKLMLRMCMAKRPLLPQVGLC